MSEEVLGSIDGVKGGRPARFWTLFVTTERIIAATVGKAGIGAGFELGGLLMAKSRARSRTERLGRLPPDEILASHKKNFEIPYSQVTSAELDDPQIVASGSLTVTTSTDTYEFALTDTENYSRQGELLKSGLKEKISFK